MTIELYGDVVADELDWLYSAFQIPHCCPKNVRDALKDLPDGEDLILEVNSPGGDVWAGFEIYGLLQKIAGRTEAHIISLCASAATTITSACTRVLASPVAQFMIHQPMAVAGFVNNEGTRQLQNFLDSVRASIINGYVVKSGGKAGRKTFEKLVDNETFMPIQDAIELGLVDGYLDTTEEADEILSAGGGLKLTNSAGSGISVEGLVERYEAAVRAGTMQEIPGHPVVTFLDEITDQDGRPRDAAKTQQAAQAETDGPQDDIKAKLVEFCLTPNDTELSNAAFAGKLAMEIAPRSLPLPMHLIDTEAVPGEDPRITENREIVENLISDWRLQAAIDLERARDPV